MVESAKRDVHFIHFLLSRPCFVCADAAIIEFATLSCLIFAYPRARLLCNQDDFSVPHVVNM